MEQEAASGSISLMAAFSEMIRTANLLDVSILGVYLIASFVIGICATVWIKADNKKEAGYFLSGRNISGWLAGTSIAVTAMNADVAPAYCGWMANTGLPMFWFYVARFGMAQLIVAMLFCYMWRHMTISTGPEFFSLRYGGRGGKFMRVYSSLWGVLIGVVPWIGVGLLGVHKIIVPIFWPTHPELTNDPTITLLIILPIMTLYVWKAGYSGVLATDFMQTVVIVLANFFICLWVLHLFKGPTGLREAVSASLPPDDLKMGLSSFLSKDNEAVNPKMMLAWFILASLGVGGGMGTEGQRVMSCRTTKEAMKSYVWAQVILFIMLLSVTLPILGLYPKHPEIFHQEPALRENAYGILLREFLPHGLQGLALAAIAAAVMSTIASHMNYSSQTLVNDVTRPFVPKMTDRQAIMLGKAYMLVILIASLVVTYKAPSMSKVASYLTGLLGGTVLFGWAQWWWWRANFFTWVTAMVGGPLIFLLLDSILQMWPWWVETSQNPFRKQALDLYQGLMSLAITTPVWLLVTIFTEPEDMEGLKEFYRRARPMGAWGPVRKAIELEDGKPLPPAKPMIGFGLVIAAVGASWVALLMMSLSQLYVGFYFKASISGVCCLIIALIFKKLFNWYYERLGGDEVLPYQVEESNVSENGETPAAV